MKKLYKILFILSMFIFVSSGKFAFADSIYVNNYKLENSKPVKAIDGRTYVAVGDFTRAVGGTYYFDQKAKKATIKFNDLVLVVSDGTKKAKLNSKDLTLKQKCFIDNKIFYLPATLMKDMCNKNISWNAKKKSLYVNSNEKNIFKNYNYDKKVLKSLEKSMGKDYNLFKFTYALTTDVNFEKYLPEGKYYIFKAADSKNPKNSLNGFFYYNLYTADVYYYPIDDKDEIKNIKKYANSGLVNDFKPTGYQNTEPLIATTRLFATINKSDSSLANFSYTRQNTIDKNYLKHIPKANYYYYKAEKKEKNKVVSSFDVAQNTKTLETYIFLKQKDGVNIVMLPEFKLVKTIKLGK